MTRPYRIRPMIPAEDIAARVATLADEINAHFAGTEKLIVVGLLRGSFVFIADLVRRLELAVEVDFLEAASYGMGTESSREVRILKDLRSPVEGRDVLVVEDIVDTGHTLKHALRLLATRKPARLEACALLDKPSRRQVEIRAKWIGFESSWSATASTTPSRTATCPTSARWSSSDSNLDGACFGGGRVDRPRMRLQRGAGHSECRLAS